MSEAIVRLVNLAEAKGLNSEVGDWTRSKVYWFNALMPADVRTAGTSEASVDYFESEGTPHNPAGEGFIDRSANTAISFLLEIKEV